MSFLIAACCALVLSLATSVTDAQEPAFAKPEQEHDWLRKFEGTWNSTTKGSMGPDQPPVECTGKIVGRMVGGFWVINDMTADVAGTQMHGVQTIGYDPAKKQYVGTWIDSMVNYMWHYEGSVDESGKKLTLDAEGPNFMIDGETAQYRDSYEFKSDDHIIVTSSMLGPDGKWITFMEGESKRVKNK